MLFPKNYLQTNKYGIKSRNDFALCFTEWQNEKISQQIGKSPFNFQVSDVERHPFEQKPIKDNFDIVKILTHPAELSKKMKAQNDDKFKAGVTDSSNKEHIPPPPPPSPYNERYKFAPTIVNVKEELDQRYKLPKVRKTKVQSQKKIEERNKKKEELKVKLSEIEDKMKLIKKTK